MDLNVCLLNDSFPPAIDGVANSVINYAGIIQQELGRCTVVTPKYPDAVDDYIFPVVRYPSINTTKLLRYRTGLPFDRKTLFALEQAKFDILHSHCPFASGLLARTLRERVDVPYVFTYHTKFDIDFAVTINSEHLRQLFTKLTINNISAVDEVWVVSEGAAQSLRSMGFEGDTILMQNGVDLPQEKTSKERTDALRHELNLPPEVPVFLFVGRMLWYKNLRITLDALSALSKLGHDFRFIAVGDGVDRQEMIEYAASLGLGKRCNFVGSVRDREKIRDYFSMADLFLFPSTYDTNGLVVREAAACALPSIIVEKSCAAEGITDGKNGLLIEESCPSMAQKLVWACTHIDQIHQIGIDAQKSIYMSWQDAVYNAYHRYELLIDKKQRGLLAHKEVRGDTMFELVSDWNAAVSKLASVPRVVLDKTNSIYEKFKR
ncbi:MAG: glycosyltransferase [Clostridia bacterium]|nr:glycosyltransferase [Clostridia bacterium]